MVESIIAGIISGLIVSVVTYGVQAIWRTLR